MICSLWFLREGYGYELFEAPVARHSSDYWRESHPDQGWIEHRPVQTLGVSSPSSGWASCEQEMQTDDQTQMPYTTCQAQALLDKGQQAMVR